MRLALALLCLPSALPAQMFDGDVVDKLTGAPIEGAYVVIPGVNSVVVRTDKTGHYRLQRPSWIPAGMTQLPVEITRAGYLEGSNHSVKAGARIELSPEAVIGGVVVDEDGFPAPGARVEAVRYRMVDGVSRLRGAGTAQSDDLGRYRIAGLPAGRYLVRVAFPGSVQGWDSRYQSQLAYGGIAGDDSRMLEVAAGQERTADVQLKKLEGFTVSGRIEGWGQGQANLSANLGLQFNDPESGLYQFWHSTGSSKDGTFTIRHVPNGKYILRFASGNYPPKLGDLAAEFPVEVSGSDVRNLVVTPRPVEAVDLAGSIVVAGGGSVTPMMINLRSDLGNLSATARSGDDGSFELKGLLPGHYRIQVIPDLRDGVAARAAGVPVSARLGEQEGLFHGLDIAPGASSPGPLRITVTSRSYPIRGKLLDSAGQPVAGARLQFQSDRPGTVADAVTDTDGSFRTSVLFPGDYRVMRADPGDPTGYECFSDPDYVAAHQNDLPVVHVVDGVNAPVTLTLRQ